MGRSDLRRVERAARRIFAAQLTLEAAIVAASRAGESLREIAKAAGRSHEHVRKVINKQERNQA
jgi:predicted transcriptional regulator